MAAALLTLTGCDAQPDRGPIAVSVIGGPIRFGSGVPRDEGARVLAGAVAVGLVRLDAAGQVEPGLAARWIVIDGGLRYIFRLGDATWSDDAPVTAQQVAAILRRRLRDDTNPLAPFLTAIDDVVAMTPQVIEVRLGRPRPDLLKLFARPELSLVRRPVLAGAGPLRIVGGSDPLQLALPVPVAGDDGAAPPQRRLTLRGERAARAIARFAAGRSDLVLGGQLADWPLVSVAGVAPTAIRLDPAAGLFGLAVARREGLLADAPGRAAIAVAIDRAALLPGLPPGTTTNDTILPERLDSAASPVTPGWATLAAGVGGNAARQLVLARRGIGGPPPRLTIALPPGPGADTLFGRLRRALAAIGVELARADTAAGADLRLIDAVAPYDSARWYLATACAPCGPEASAAIEAARTAPDADARARALAIADAALAQDVAFIPLLRPVRWSLVSARLTAFQGNARAWHPLDQLRNDPDD